MAAKKTAVNVEPLIKLGQQAVKALTPRGTRLAKAEAMRARSQAFNAKIRAQGRAQGMKMPGDSPRPRVKVPAGAAVPGKRLTDMARSDWNSNLSKGVQRKATQQSRQAATGRKAAKLTGAGVAGSAAASAYYAKTNKTKKTGSVRAVMTRSSGASMTGTRKSGAQGASLTGIRGRIGPKKS